MGYYINPPEVDGEVYEETKLNWLRAHLQEKQEGFTLDDMPEDEVPIVIIDNGPFYAAMVAYNRREYDEGAAPDGRHKFAIIVKKADVIELHPFMAEVLARPFNTEDQR